jgi:hypothetical protein
LLVSGALECRPAGRLAADWPPCGACMHVVAAAAVAAAAVAAAAVAAAAVAAAAVVVVLLHATICDAIACGLRGKH